nr:hypothetical protein [Bradyrhizobium sp. CCBAU 11434]
MQIALIDPPQRFDQWRIFTDDECTLHDKLILFVAGESAGRDIPCNHRARGNDGSGTHLDADQHHGAGANMNALANRHTPAQHRPRSNMRMIADNAIVLDHCARIDQGVLPDARRGLDHGTGHHLRAVAKLCIGGDYGGSMRNHRKSVAPRGEPLEQGSPVGQSGIAARGAVAETVGKRDLISGHFQDVVVRSRDPDAANNFADARGVGHSDGAYAAAQQRLDDDTGMTAGAKHDQTHSSSASLAA